MSLLMWLALASPAYANDEAKALFLNGKELYNQGRYESAIEAWKAAYELDPRPALQLNLANAYERTGQFPESLEALQSYRIHAKAEEAESLDSRIRGLERRVDEIKAAEAEEKRLKAEAAAKLEEERRRAEELARQQAEASASKPSIVGPVVVTAAGLGLIGVGAYSGVRASAARKDIRDLCVDGVCQSQAEPLLKRQRSSALLADVSLATGVVATGIGVLWLVKTKNKASDVAWTPLIDVTPGRTTVGVTHAF